VSFSVKAKRKDGESKMTIKIGWKDAKNPAAGPSAPSAWNPRGGPA
jgi:hypothetical protein